MPVRVLVADDSVVFRRVITEALSSLPDVEVVGSVPNGKLAVQKVRELQPDLLTLDMEMPEMDGLAVLDALRKTGEKIMVIAVSSFTLRGGQITLKALEKGALDFITKPETSSAQESREVILRELAPRIRALAHRQEIRRILTNTKPTVAPAKGGSVGETVPAMSSQVYKALRTKPEMVLIGVSTGGPNALSQLLPQIPGDIGVPFMVVQHMPALFTRSLAQSLSTKCALQVCEASHGERVVPNMVYIAPGGKQMRLGGSTGGAKSIEITDDPPENNCRPAVDYLFRSAAHNFPGRAMAVVLTGMGSDGTLGLRLLKRHGCYVIAQDEASCVVFGMPKAAIEARVVDAVLPLDAIADRILAAVRGCCP